MILPRRLALLVLMALAVFVSLTEAATATSAEQAAQTARHQSGGKRAVQKWRKKMARGTAKVLEAVKAARNNPELQASSDIVAETKTYKAAVIYSWSNSECSGNAYGATYYGTACAAHEGGLSTRYNCVITGTDPSTGKKRGEIQYHGFENSDCSGEPVAVHRFGEGFVVGECDDESLVECSNDVELKHGLDDNTVAYAVYADSSCKTLYLATFYPYGCDGDGFKEFCEGDEGVSQTYENANCTGAVWDEERHPADVCEVGEDDDDDDADDDNDTDEDDGAGPVPAPHRAQGKGAAPSKLKGAGNDTTVDDDDDDWDDDWDDDTFVNLSGYEMYLCDGNDVKFPENSAPIAGFSWTAALLAALASCALMMRA